MPSKKKRKFDFSPSPAKKVVFYSSQKSLNVLRENIDDADSGVYFISDNTNIIDKKQKLRVKIGRAINLYHRLDSYLLCFPDGYSLLGFLTTRNKKDSIRLETMLLRYSKKKYGSINHKLIHGHSSEWFRMNLNDLKDIFRTIKSNAKTVKRKDEKLFFPHQLENWQIFA